MSIDWTELEDRLYDLATADIKRFATSHSREKFYGFALDCHSAYGTVVLCFNTPSFLRAAIRDSHLPAEIRDGYEKAKRSIEAALGMKVYEDAPDLTPEEREKELRWSLGDWKYQGFNSIEFDAGWQPFQGVVHACVVEEEEDKETSMTPTQDRFMHMACRALLRLELVGVFSMLKRTDDFMTFVADHDESDEKSWRRLNSVRNETRKS